MWYRIVDMESTALGQTRLIDDEELIRTGEMARLSLSPTEVRRFRESVGQMLLYFSKMAEVDTAALEPTTHALVRENRLRDDRAVSGEAADRLLENAPECEDRFISVPNVL